MNKRQSQVHPRTTNNMAIEYRDDAEDPPIDTHMFTTNPAENTVSHERDVTPSSESVSVKRSRSEEEPLIGSEQPMGEEEVVKEKAEEEDEEEEMEDTASKEVSLPVPAEDENADQLADVTEAEQAQDQVMTSQKPAPSRPVSRMTRKSVVSEDHGTILPGQVVSKKEEEEEPTATQAEVEKDDAIDAPDSVEPEAPAADVTAPEQEEVFEDNVSDRTASAAYTDRPGTSRVRTRPSTSKHPGIANDMS